MLLSNDGVSAVPKLLSVVPVSLQFVGFSSLSPSQSTCERRSWHLPDMDGVISEFAWRNALLVGVVALGEALLYGLEIESLPTYFAIWTAAGSRALMWLALERLVNSSFVLS